MKFVLFFGPFRVLSWFLPFCLSGSDLARATLRRSYQCKRPHAVTTV